MVKQYIQLQLQLFTILTDTYNHIYNGDLANRLSAVNVTTGKETQCNKVKSLQNNKSHLPCCKDSADSHTGENTSSSVKPAEWDMY